MDLHAVTKDYEGWQARHHPLVAAALERKHELLASGPAPFLRGTFYLWVKRWPEACPELARTPAVLAVGDLHVSNFGTWRDAEGRLVWGVNDFDEAYPGAYAQDLVRLACSAILARDAGHLALGCAELCAAVADGYAQGLDRGGEPYVLAESHGWLRELAVGAQHEPGVFWKKLEELPPFGGTVSPDAVRLLEALLPEPGLAYQRRARVAGVGSLGLPRMVALAPWRGGFVAREAKARVPSASAWIAGGDGPDHYADALQRSVRAPDPLVRATAGWLVRRLAPDCARVELESLPRKRDEARLLAAMGRETANVHLGTPAAIREVVRDLRGRPAGWLHDAARRMADVVEQDARAWKAG